MITTNAKDFVTELEPIPQEEQLKNCKYLERLEEPHG